MIIFALDFCLIDTLLQLEYIDSYVIIINNNIALDLVHRIHQVTNKFVLL